MYSINSLSVGLGTEYETQNSTFRSIKLYDNLPIIILRILLVYVLAVWLFGVLCYLSDMMYLHISGQKLNKIRQA